MSRARKNSRRATQFRRLVRMVGREYTVNMRVASRRQCCIFFSTAAFIYAGPLEGDKVRPSDTLGTNSPRLDPGAIGRSFGPTAPPSIPLPVVKDPTIDIGVSVDKRITLLAAALPRTVPAVLAHDGGACCANRNSARRSTIFPRSARPSKPLQDESAPRGECDQQTCSASSF